MLHTTCRGSWTSSHNFQSTRLTMGVNNVRTHACQPVSAPFGLHALPLQDPPRGAMIYSKKCDPNCPRSPPTALRHATADIVPVGSGFATRELLCNNNITVKITYS